MVTGAFVSVKVGGVLAILNVGKTRACRCGVVLNSRPERPTGTALVALLVAAGAFGCDYRKDVVEPGYYGSAGTSAAMDSAGTATMSSQGTAQGTGQGAGGSLTGASGTAGAAGVGGANVGALAGDETALGGSVEMETSPGDSASQPAMGGEPSGDSPGSAGACELSGPWLVTEHLATDALGQLQYGHYYYYYEIAQSGEVFEVTRGTLCGNDAVGVGLFAVTVSQAGGGAADREHVNHAGRRGVSRQVAAGCEIAFDKWYTARGVTLPFYEDPANPLPTVDDPAVGGEPGWEDWDADGKPGLTGNLSGTVEGKVFVAPRYWTEPSGTVPSLMSPIKLSVRWNQEPNVIAFEGSPLLAMDAAVAADPDLHFLQMARLDASQVPQGDVHSLCDWLVGQAPTLTPEAASAEEI